MKQTKISDFKYSKPSFINSLLVYKRNNFFYKIYYWLMDFKLLYYNKQKIKYSVISFSGEIIDYSFLILFTEVFNVFYILSALFSYLIALTNNFLLNMKFTFKYNPLNTKDFVSSFINYILVSIFGLILNIGLIALLVELFGFNYLIAKLIASFLIFFLMFTGHNFILRKKEVKFHK